MKSKRRTKKNFMFVGIVATILIASVFIIGISTIGQTTIYNRPAFDPIAFELSVYDNNGADITDTFDDATIEGLISFGVLFTKGTDRIHHVTLNITGTSEGASPGGSFILMNSVSNTNLWEISFDTTRLENGDYDFDFIYTEEQPALTYGGDPEILIVPFSSFLFSMEGGSGTLSSVGSNIILIMAIIVIVALAGTAVFVSVIPKRKKKRSTL